MLNEKERARLSVIRGAIDGVYTVAKAAVKIGESPRLQRTYAKLPADLQQQQQAGAN